MKLKVMKVPGKVQHIDVEPGVTTVADIRKQLQPVSETLRSWIAGDRVPDDTVIKEDTPHLLFAKPPVGFGPLGAIKNMEDSTNEELRSYILRAEKLLHTGVNSYGTTADQDQINCARHLKQDALAELQSRNE